MGKKGSWFSSVMKALNPDSKEKAEKKESQRRNSLGKKSTRVPESSTLVASTVSPPHPVPSVEVVELPEVEEEQTKHAYAVAVSTSAAAEIAAGASQFAAEVIPVTKVTQFAGKSKEEVAIKIQTAFRGYLDRRALRALRGLVRIKSLTDGPTAKQKTSHTLKCMQTLSCVQSQISSRRIRMLEENRALQRQLMHKHAKELESLKKSTCTFPCPVRR